MYDQANEAELGELRLFVSGRYESRIGVYNNPEGTSGPTPNRYSDKFVMKTAHIHRRSSRTSMKGYFNFLFNIALELEIGEDCAVPMKVMMVGEPNNADLFIMSGSEEMLDIDEEDRTPAHQKAIDACVPVISQERLEKHLLANTLSELFDEEGFSILGGRIRNMMKSTSDFVRRELDRTLSEREIFYQSNPLMGSM